MKIKTLLGLVVLSPHPTALGADEWVYLVRWRLVVESALLVDVSHVVVAFQNAGPLHVSSCMKNDLISTSDPPTFLSQVTTRKLAEGF